MIRFIPQLEIGIDLGTTNTLAYLKAEGIRFQEPSAIAFNRKTSELIAYGLEAKKMLGRTPSHLVAIKPLQQGVVSDFEATEQFLKVILSALKKQKVYLKRPRVIVGIPMELTEVQKKAVIDAVASAGAKEVYLVEEPIAAALGGNLPINEAKGALVVDVGGGTTDVAVISLGGIVVGRSLKVAGERFNQDLAEYARSGLQLIIGEEQAEEAKIHVGSVHPRQSNYQQEVYLLRGRDVNTGLPKEVQITPAQTKEAFEASVRLITQAIKDTIETTPSELLGDILLEGGISLTGGGSLLRGLKEAIEKETRLKVIHFENPLYSVIRGIGMIIEHFPKLRHYMITV